MSSERSLSLLKHHHCVEYQAVQVVGTLIWDLEQFVINSMHLCVVKVETSEVRADSRGWKLQHVQTVCGDKTSEARTDGC